MAWLAANLPGIRTGFAKRRYGGTVHKESTCAAKVLGHELSSCNPRSLGAAPLDWLVPPPREGSGVRL